MHLMCGPRQLFFQCGPETPKGWTPLHIRMHGIVGAAELLTEVQAFRNDIAFVSKR